VLGESVGKDLRPRSLPTNLHAAVSRPSTTDRARPPLLLASGDFDAPGRTRFVERALAWIAPLSERLARAGVAVEASPLPAAETHAIALRRPGLGPRAALVLDVDDRGIEAALELPAAAPEMEQLRAQLQNGVAAQQVAAAFAHLPEPIAFVLDGEFEVPIHAIDIVTLEHLVRRAVEESRRLRIGFRVPRTVALVPSAVALADQLEGVLAALAVPFALLEAPLRARPALFRRPLPNTRSASRDSKKPLAVGSRVRIQSGPFEGQDGVVETLDGKGGARIRLGLLATRLDVTELLLSVPPKTGRRPREQAVSKRPALGSSHRRR